MAYRITLSESDNFETEVILPQGDSVINYTLSFRRCFGNTWCNVKEDGEQFSADILCITGRLFYFAHGNAFKYVDDLTLEYAPHDLEG